MASSRVSLFDNSYSLDVDGLAAAPITNPELHQRMLQVQTMAGRTLPHAMQAFLELLKRAIDEPATWIDAFAY